ncbi:dystroglycan-like [Dorcoceras hygrometricum]|uniref:Dystroglycan-like n=1 Tax=Dorcoceras hygrometricum TaxID=472368 RepID=A0A2Z7CLR5_9LAMI|nr:dystroglycan-like [Dorcoceras hygrometricum]
MVKEYRKLSHSFEEAKAENMSLKSSSIESSSDELEDIDSLKTELSKLTAENDVLKNETSELKAEIEVLKQVVSAWNRSSRSLHKLNESQKLDNDKSGLGFNSSEFSEGETSTQSQQAYDKFNKMNFVKANVTYDCFESVKYDDQNSPKLSDNGKAGIGFSKPESFKPNWMKNKLDKDKAKAGQKPFVPNQPWRSSKKVFHQLFSSTMASAYYSNTVHIDFASVLAMENPGIVSVLNAMMTSGLEGFLGCPTVIYESELVDFFNNGSVRDGLVVSTVNGVPVEISEWLFAETFELPVDGLADLSDMPKDKIFDSRSNVLLSGEPVSLSGRKGQMKIEYRLLCDIMAKSISVKAGSFNALTVEKFTLFTAVVCGIKMNWDSILFNILKKMVSAGSKQAKGFALQISLLLESIPNLELGESMEFPASKILTYKTVHRYISFNDKVGVEEAVDAPPMKTAPRKPAASRKRPAVATAREPVPKKKRTSKNKSGSSSSTLEMVVVAQEAVPLQMVEPSTGVPTAEEPVEQPVAEEDISADQPVYKVTGEVGVKEVAAEIDASADRDKPADTTEERQWFDLSHEELIAKWAAERLVTTPDDTDEEIKAGRPVCESVEAFAPVVEVGEAAADKDFLPVDDPDTVINQILHQLDSISDDKADNQSDKAEAWFDRAFDEMLRHDPDEEAETVDVGTAGGDQQVEISEEEPVDKSVDDFINADEKLSLEDILMTIPADVILPSAGIEITKIMMGKSIKIPGVDERTWYLDNLPKIPADDKGKKYSDIDLLVNLRAQVIEAVDQFFHSFSFKKLATVNIEELSRKEEQVLIWGETEITHVALSRKRYILLKYREVLVRKFLESWKNNFVPGQGSTAVDLKVIDLLSDVHLFVLEELREQALAHGLKWTRTCCSKIIEGHPRDRGAIIARTNTNTKSTCWLRTMIRVDGVWVVEPFCDQWVKIPRPVVCTEVSKQRSFVDFFPPMSEHLRILRKIWADLEVVGFCASRRLLPVGSLQFCRSLSVVEPVFRVAPRQSPVFALRVSQFCSVFIDFSLFSWLPTADITDFLSSIALDRIIFRDVQIAQNIVSVTPLVQLTLDQHQSSPTSSEDTSMSFDDTDIAATAPTFSQPGSSTVSLDITEAIHQLRTLLDQISNRDDGAALKDIILMHLHDIEKKFTARFDTQDRWLGALRNYSNDQRNLLSLEIKSSQRQLNTQITAVAIDQIDMRRDVKELNAKVDAMATNLEILRRDAEATKEAISHQLLEFQAQEQANHNILHAQLSELVNILIGVVMPKGGKEVAADLSLLFLLMFKI